jgi:adenylate cyclase
LAAIMFSDIAGYTLVMGRDEQRAMRVLAEHRALLRKLVPNFNGRMLGEIGDGTLSAFHSVVDAVNCAREIQAATKDSSDLRLRIGIHLGDVLFTSDNVWGDGVNIASRIHALAPPGAICVSEHVFHAIRNQPGMAARNLGQKRLKNVSYPIGVYLLSGADDTRAAPLIPLSRARPLPMAIGIVLLMALIGFKAMRWKPSHVFSESQRGAQARVIRSIAVLPLDNFSGDPSQEYFADCMTDELTTDLATISALRVISRTSVMQFKGEHRKPLPEIARELNVDAVVEGSVMRAGDRVRITAQLIDASNDKHLWAKTYERDARDVLAMQDEVALAIAHEINVELTPNEQARFAGTRTVNPEAHEAYLKGRYFLDNYSEERVKKAIAQFQQAISIDPKFVLAYTGLADAYGYSEDWYFPANEVMPKSRAAAEKALQLDDSSAEAHTSLGFVVWQYDYDWVAGEREYRRAIALNPNYYEAHHQYGYLLAFAGRFDESVAEFTRANEMDPLSSGILNDLAWPLMFEGKSDAARDRIHKALELDPSFYLAQFTLGWIDIEEGNPHDAIAELEKARAMDAPPFVTGFLGYACAVAGDRARAQATLTDLRQMSTHRFVSPFATAVVYLGLGDKPRALGELENAYAARSWMMTWLKLDKIFDPLRSDPRFIALLRKVGPDR